MDKLKEFDALEAKKDRFEKEARMAAKPFLDKANKVETEIIELLTDIKKGDTITWRRGRGRRRGIVRRVYRAYGISINYRIIPILKNGTEGRDTDVREWENIQKENA
tara:strand:+ start:465 stop:785 length:321 start_codon:yes stop_codon:yes gene_type:complete